MIGSFLLKLVGHGAMFDQAKDFIKALEGFKSWKHILHIIVLLAHFTSSKDHGTLYSSTASQLLHHVQVVGLIPTMLWQCVNSLILLYCCCTYSTSTPTDIPSLPLNLRVPNLFCISAFESTLSIMLVCHFFPSSYPGDSFPRSQNLGVTKSYHHSCLFLFLYFILIQKDGIIELKCRPSQVRHILFTSRDRISYKPPTLIVISLQENMSLQKQFCITSLKYVI